MRTVKLRDPKVGIALAMPSLAVVVVVMFLPIVYSVYVSLRDVDLLRPWSAPYVGLQNYRAILSDPALVRSLTNTAVYAVASIAVEVLVGLGFAVLLNQRIGDGGVFRTLLTMPLFVAPVVVGLQWRWLLINEYGVLNYVLGALGIRGPTWLGTPGPAMASVVIADSWLVTPFSMLVLLAGLQGIPQELLEAASIDGASSYQRFVRVTLPLLRPALLVIILIRTIDAVRVFDLVWILTGGGPASATEMLSTLTYRMAFQYFKMGQASALAIVIVVILCVLSAVLIKTTGAMRTE